MQPIEPIRSAARQLVRELQLLDTRHCIEGFSFSECHLVTELAGKGQATATELAELLVLDKSTLSRLVQSLKRRGHLRVDQDPADRRRKLLSLTDKGRQGAGRIHRFASSQVASALSFLTHDEQAAVVAGLERYARALGFARLGQQYKLRPIRASDNPAVARIIRQVMTEFGAVGKGYSIEDPEVDDMTAAYAGKGSKFFVITRQRQVLGCGGVGPLADGDGSTCELRKMYFLPELRGTGQGSRLLQHCLQVAGDLGYRQCYLETLTSMSQARHLYRKHGFEPLDQPMGNTGHSGCNQWMIKTLV